MINSDLISQTDFLMLSSGAGLPLSMALASIIPFTRRAVQRLLPLAALPSFYCSFAVERDMVIEVPWFFMGGQMGVDSVSQVFLCVCAFIWFLSALALNVNHRLETDTNFVIIFFLTAMAGNFGLILAQDMLGFYLFFAMMSFSVYGVVIFLQTDFVQRAGRIYIIMVVLGEVAMFTAMIYLAQQSGSIAFSDIGKTSPPFFILVLLFIGFGVKIGAFPLHIWMPVVYRATPAAAGVALAGAMVNAGLLGWLRFLPLGQDSSMSGAFLFIFCGMLSTLYGVIMGIGQKNPKTVLAYSSISQMGLMTSIIGLGLVKPELSQAAVSVLVIFMVHHALAKSCLFLGLSDETTSRRQPLTRHIIIMLLPALALAGLPLTSGSIAKNGFKWLVSASGPGWQELFSFFLPVSSLATTLLMLHFIRLLFLSSKQAQPEDFKRQVPWIISLAAVGSALWLWPAAASHAHHSLTITVIWHSLLPVTIGILLFYTMHRLDPERQSLYQIPEGDLLVIFEDICKMLQQLFTSIPSFKRTEQKNVDWSKISAMLDFTPELRKDEKILGRWIVTGFCSLILFGLLLLLLL